MTLMANPNRTQRLSPLHRVAPYFALTEKEGWREYTIFNHMITPSLSHWLDPSVVYDALTQRAILVATGAERQIEIKGPDAVKFADYVTTRDMTKLRVHQAAYGFCCDEEGIIVSDVVIVRPAEDTVWLSVSDADLELWCRGIALHTAHRVSVGEADIAPIQLQGPRSRDILRTIVGPALDALKFFHCMPARIAGTDVYISRTGWTGELGYEIYPFGSANAPAVWEALSAAGQGHELLISGLSLARAIESGILAFTFGMREDRMNPLEHWRSNVVDFQKVNFIGKSALQQIVAAGGPQRRHIGLVGSPDRFPGMERPWNVLDAGQAIGHTRWTAYSPSLGRNIAIALIPSTYSTFEGSLEVASSDGKHEQMRVTALPFIDREGRRVRA